MDEITIRMAWSIVLGVCVAFFLSVTIVLAAIPKLGLVRGMAEVAATD